MSETRSSSTGFVYKGPRGRIQVHDENDKDSEHPNATKARSFSVSNTRLYMACQDKDQESPVRRRTKKSLLASRITNARHSKFGPLSSKEDLTILDFSKENIARFKGRIQLSGELKKNIGGYMDAYRAAAETDRKSRREGSFFRKKFKKVSCSSISTQYLQNMLNYLSPLEATAVIAVFDIAYDDLAVIKTLLPQIFGIKHFHKYRTLEERYGKEQVKSMPELEEESRSEDLLKLQEDRSFIAEILRRTTEDLQQHSNYWTLHSTIRGIHQMDQDDMQILMQWPVMRERVLAAREEVRKAIELAGPQTMKQMLKDIQEQDETGDVEMLLAAEMRYVERWEAARRAQQLTRTGLRERALNKALELAKHSLDVEVRAAQQTKLVILQEEHELKLSLAEWDKRRFADMDQMTITIFQIRNTLELAQLQTASMSKEVAKRAMELRTWHVNKDEQQRLNNAALAIQNGWRAALYRRLVRLGLMILKRSRMQLLKDAAEVAALTRASVRTRIRLEKDRERHVNEYMLRAYNVFQGLNGSVDAQEAMIKEGRIIMKGAKGAKGKGKGGK